jgi:hypothetical protein
MKEVGDFKHLIGKTLDEAKKERTGREIIVVGERNGESFYHSAEFNPNRIIVIVKGNTITKIDSVG